MPVSVLPAAVVPLDVAAVRLVARATCGRCGGTGTGVSPDWESYAAWAGRRGVSIEPRHDEREREFFVGVSGLGVVPPMTEPCPPCAGSGAIDTEVPVQTLAETLLRSLSLPVVPPGELADAVERVKATMLGATQLAQERHAYPGGSDVVREMLNVARDAADALHAMDQLRPRTADGGQG